jgi:peptidyl-tRNA hydrolase
MVKIAGIGNSMYPGTRHSLGLTFMDYLATLLRPEVPVDQFYTDQRTLSGSIKLLTFHFTDANRFQLPLLEGKETILFKSQEFMNFSGYPIHALCK